MSLNEQDARALIHLAKRLRQDTYGAGTWDQPGVEAEVLRLVGQDLAISIERVTRHAADPSARTPGAIRRPYTPGPPEARRELDSAPVGSRCTTCGLIERDCRSRWSTDHQFTRPIEPLPVDARASVVVEIKGHLEPTKPRPEPTERKRDPHVEQVRELLHTDTCAPDGEMEETNR